MRNSARSSLGSILGAMSNDALTQKAIDAGEVILLPATPENPHGGYDTPEGALAALELAVELEGLDSAITIRMVQSKRFEKGFAVVSLFVDDTPVPYPLKPDVWAQLKDEVIKAWNTYVESGGMTAGGTAEGPKGKSKPSLVPPVDDIGNQLELAVEVLQNTAEGLGPTEGMTFIQAVELASPVLQIQARSLSLGRGGAGSLNPDIEGLMRALLGEAGVTKARVLDLIDKADAAGVGVVLAPAEVKVIADLNKAHSKLAAKALGFPH